MPYEQINTSVKPPQTNPESGINLRVAYQALIDAYQRTNGSSVSRRSAGRTPDHKGEQNGKDQI